MRPWSEEDFGEYKRAGHPPNAEGDVDYGHDHKGVGDPHVHDWDWSEDDPRYANPPRAPYPGEPLWYAPVDPVLPINPFLPIDPFVPLPILEPISVF
jgi:hypothetical protein